VGSNDVHLDKYCEKQVCVFTPHKQNAEQNHNVTLAHIFGENVVKFTCFGMIRANQSFNEEHIKSGC